MLYISEPGGIREVDDDAGFVISVELGNMVGPIVC
jgi:hypothetical protein